MSHFIFQLLLMVTYLACSEALSQQQLSSTPCPLLGPDYPALQYYMGTSPIVEASKSALQSIQKGVSSGEFGNTTSFSLNVFSINDDQPLFEHYYTAPNLAKASVGVTQTGPNSIYRIGSVSKLITVYIYLIKAGFEGWYDPITKYVPELADYAQKHSGPDTEIDAYAFEDITIEALATHLAGFPHDLGSPMNDHSIESVGLQLPPHAPFIGKYCGNPGVELQPCDRAGFFANLFETAPLHPPESTPIYNNIGYYLMSLALENITNSQFPDLFQSALVQPLGLNSTFYSQPPSTSSGVIPGNTSVSGWEGFLYDGTPGGGYYSSSHDLAAIGRSILNSTLISPATTRTWMKPRTMTSNPNYNIGAVWQIVPAPTKRISYLYTKDGDVGHYATYLVLMPDYGIGFTVLSASTTGDPLSAKYGLSNILATAFAPAAEAATKQHAAQIYPGTYHDANSNSTLAVNVTAEDPGLVLTTWIINGTDIKQGLTEYRALQSAASSSAGGSTKEQFEVHLYPTGLEQAVAGNGTATMAIRQSWRAVFETLPQQVTGPLTPPCQTWDGPSAYVWGNEPLDGFEFVLSDSSDAAAVQGMRWAGLPGVTFVKA